MVATLHTPSYMHAEHWVVRHSVVDAPGAYNKGPSRRVHFAMDDCGRTPLCTVHTYTVDETVCCENVYSTAHELLESYHAYKALGRRLVQTHPHVLDAIHVLYGIPSTTRTLVASADAFLQVVEHARGLERFVSPLPREHRRWVVRSVLHAQAMHCHVDATARATLLRLRSEQHTARSRDFAVRIAQGDAWAVQWED
jgi:hypothetical protein